MNDKAKCIEIDDVQKARIDRVRENFSHMYDMLEILCKSSRETSLAITRLEEAQYWAIKSISRQ